MRLSLNSAFKTPIDYQIKDLTNVLDQNERIEHRCDVIVFEMRLRHAVNSALSLRKKKQNLRKK